MLVAEQGKSSISLGVIIGIAVAGIILVLVLIGVGTYAYRQKRRAEKAKEASNPFGTYIMKILFQKISFNKS